MKPAPAGAKECPDFERMLMLIKSCSLFDEGRGKIGLQARNLIFLCTLTSFCNAFSPHTYLCFGSEVLLDSSKRNMCGFFSPNTALLKSYLSRFSPRKRIPWTSALKLRRKSGVMSLAEDNTPVADASVTDQRDDGDWEVSVPARRFASPTFLVQEMVTDDGLALSGSILRVARSNWVSLHLCSCLLQTILSIIFFQHCVYAPYARLDYAQSIIYTYISGSQRTTPNY